MSSDFEKQPGFLDLARTAGAILLLIPVVTGIALSFFPSYDARPEYFAPSYSNIVEAGSTYLVSLLLFLAVAALLLLLALTLRRAPSGKTSGGMVVVTAGLTASAMGFGLASLLGIPVWFWSRQVTDGVLTMSEAASKAETWASASQTLILLVGLGGLGLALTVLGVVAYRSGWTTPVVFWTTIVVVVGVVIVGFAMTLFWFALGIPPILWTLMIGLSLVVLGTYPVEDSDAPP